MQLAARLADTHVSGVAEALWFAIYPLAVLALGLLIRRLRPRARVEVWLDAAIVALTTAAVMYHVLFEPIDEATHAGASTPLLLDIILVAVLLTVAIGAGGMRRALVLAGLGLTVLLVTDAVQLALGGDTGAMLLALGRPLALLLLALALRAAGPLPEVAPLRGRAFMVMTTAAVVSSAVLLVIETKAQTIEFDVIFAAVVPLLVVARLLCAVRDNERLAADHDTILAAAGAGIVRLDGEGRVRFINPSAERILGWGPGDLEGEDWHGLMHSAQDPVACAQCRAQRSDGIERLRGEMMRRADGSLFAADYTCAPVHNTGEASGSVIVFDNVTTRRRLESQLRHQAQHDALTGLINRRHFTDLLDEQLKFAARTSTDGALAIIDLDGFQFVNDAFGHLAGDEVMQRVAALLRDACGHHAVVARLGGDEFAVMFPAIDHATVADEVKAITATIARGTQPRIEASAGVALFDGTRGRDASELLIAADVALHEAKARRNAVVTYESVGGGTLMWVDNLRRAIDEESFVLHAQPVVDLRTGELAYHELLVRMRNDDGELVPPSSFLPTAERFGLIHQLDRLIVRKAIAAAQTGQTVAVNLSGRSLGDEEIIATVRAAINAGLPPRRISFEITETSATTDIEGAAMFARELTDLGCNLAIDDFGTGFGSLMYLQRLPVHTIKIDMTFVHELTRREVDHQLVSALVSMAKSLGQKTVAEGVEDADTLLMLRSLGVDYAQGYFIGRPAELEQGPWLGGDQARAAIRRLAMRAA